MAKAKVVFEIQGADAPLATSGSLWRLPLNLNDEPIYRSLVVAAGDPREVEIEEGPNTYYFGCSVQFADESFVLVVKYVDGVEIARLAVEKTQGIPHFLRFTV